MSRARIVAPLVGISLVGVSLLSSAGCDPRAIPPREASWQDVAPILEARCVTCHGPMRAEAGYRLDTHDRTVACPSSAPDTSAVSPADERAALLAILASDDHRGLLDEGELALVRAWIEGGAPPDPGAVHPLGWSDPRSPAHHARALRAEGWARLFATAAERGDACTRCHAGASPEAEDPDRSVAPGASDCRTCHVDTAIVDGEAAPLGPFACSTCHGTPGRAYPPRDRCAHPSESVQPGAHEAHVRAGLACATCHAERTIAELRDPGASGHGDGVLDLRLDAAIAGEGATVNESDGSCTTACHARGGSVPRPRWLLDHDLDCGSCHESPPADHYAGPCSSCHEEASADGTALVAHVLHANGRVDLGDGSGGCGACHGEGEDPWPRTGAHLAHAHPADALEVACSECHVVPERVEDAGHLDRGALDGADVRFGARASARGAAPVREAEGCREVACHGAGLGGGSEPTPQWGDVDGTAARCGACHAIPPPAPHTRDTGCSAIACHGGYATADRGVSALGRTVHTNGTIDLWGAR